MWMTDYIREIQRQFVEVYHFPRRVDPPGSTWAGMPDIVPAEGAVPDGEYPMTIEGKRDNVMVVNGFIKCCNFSKKKKQRGYKNVGRNSSPRAWEKGHRKSK